jgi:hypothetical protein
MIDMITRKHMGSYAKEENTLNLSYKNITLSSQASQLVKHLNLARRAFVFINLIIQHRSAQGLDKAFL